MYYRKALGAVLLMLVLAACVAGRESVPTVKLEEPFALSVADSVWLKDGKTQFWLSLKNIQDSRCPKDVNCITGGKASVALAVEAQPEVFSFCVGSDCSRNQNNSFLVEYNNSRYNIVLEEVSPYPESGSTGLIDKKAIFKIKRATR